MRQIHSSHRRHIPHPTRSRSTSEGLLRVGRPTDVGKVAPEMISIVKRNDCGKAHIPAVERNMRGGNGIQVEYHVMRYAANLETVSKMA
jgi:glutaryl-CoA dehydrogenase